MKSNPGRYFGGLLVLPAWLMQIHRGAGGPAAREHWNILKNHIKNSSKTGVFWSGTHKGVSVQRSAEKHAKKVDGSTIGQDLKAVAIKPPTRPTNPDIIKKWWDTASKLKADHSAGPVHAVLGSKVRKDSVWNTVEEPALKKNKKVPSISQIHPGTGQEVKKLKP
jgi:hypothetical protein